MGKKDERKAQEKALLTFLKLTHDGKFAKIEESSLSYLRMKEQREDQLVYQEEYFYSVR